MQTETNTIITLVNPVQTLGKKQTKLMCTSLEYGYFNAEKPDSD